MLKELSLDNFWNAGLFSTKKQSIKAVKKDQSRIRFWFSAALIAANAVLLMSYIYGVNEFASSGYELRSLQVKLSALSEDNKKINLKVSEASSMVQIQNDFLSANYVPAGTSKFLQSAPEFTFNGK